MIGRPQVENAPERTHGSVMPEFNPEGSVLRRQQLRMLNLLVEVDRICRKYNLRYWISSGTLLGAIRHGGFIPWDDDLDMEMPRRDYKCLLKILPGELSKNMVLQTAKTDPGCFLTFAKVRDLNSRISEENGVDRLFTYRGVFLDIFPVEKSNNVFRFVAQKSIGLIYNMLRKSSGMDKQVWRKMRIMRFLTQGLMFPILRGLSYLFPRSLSICLGVPPYWLKFTEKDVFPLQEIEFEGHYFLCPHNPDRMLQLEYGDYMQLPPADKLCPPHTENIILE